jgi:uncharacterized protein YndB with AHSA1/START domain
VTPYGVRVAEIRRSRTIAAEAQAIWDVLADFGAISSWAGNVDHSCLLSPAAEDIGPGTTRRVQVGRDTLVERITEFDPPQSLAYDVEGFPRRLRRLENRWTLRPAGGGTSVTLTTTIEIGRNPVQRLAERAVARLSARQLDTMLTGLAHRLEAAHD